MNTNYRGTRATIVVAGLVEDLFTGITAHLPEATMMVMDIMDINPVHLEEDHVVEEVEDVEDTEVEEKEQMKMMMPSSQSPLLPLLKTKNRCCVTTYNHL